jgi:putative endonuclease
LLRSSKKRIGTQTGTVLYLAQSDLSVAKVTMKFYYVYVLQNFPKNYLYIGYSEDLRKRLISHNKGQNKSTKPYIPLELIHYEAYKNIDDAKRREFYLKSNRGKTTLKTMLKEYFKNFNMFRSEK